MKYTVTAQLLSDSLVHYLLINIHHKSVNIHVSIKH